MNDDDLKYLDDLILCPICNKKMFLNKESLNRRCDICKLFLTHSFYGAELIKIKIIPYEAYCCHDLEFYFIKDNFPVTSIKFINIHECLIFIKNLDIKNYIDKLIIFK